MSLLTRNFKITTDEQACSSFMLSNLGLQVILTLAVDKKRFEVDISDGLVNSMSSYCSKNPLTMKDLLIASKDAMKNFHITKENEKDRTWLKYKNPNR